MENTVTNHSLYKFTIFIVICNEAKVTNCKNGHIQGKMKQGNFSAGLMRNYLYAF